MKYHGSSISDILDDQGWIRCLKREDVASVDLVWEFYVTLLEVTDIDAQVWSITIRGVTFLLSANILSAFLGLQRPIGAYPAVEMENKPDAEDIFLTFMGWDMVVVGPFVTKVRNMFGVDWVQNDDVKLVILGLKWVCGRWIVEGSVLQQSKSGCLLWLSKGILGNSNRSDVPQGVQP
ncbi:hypothetical protein CJ030_MR6G025252 [Morella rubra]|uniref:Uncharacterized protein n=1 Tax=Morella rubra TaxID=262757 RepID=A0A6A1VDM7_9ROSI|nr:hypothetical protein CJ030_MR6G025252 [Morella rubra]